MTQLVTGSTAKVRLTAEREGPRYYGHLWVFDSNVADVLGTPAAGDLVDVYTHQKRFFGRGLFNPHSKIRIRMLTFQEEPIDEEFFAARLRAAAALRRTVAPHATACRLVHGESDLLPGLVVDRFADVAVMQTLGYGMDVRKELLGELLVQEAGVKTVYLRNDAKSRTLEGLPLSKGFLRGEGATTVNIHEGKAQFTVDIAEGQKTGWFCDQRENRIAAALFAKGKIVLEAFCHTGGFGIQAALAGAQSVEGLDVSAAAVALAQAHAEQNQVSARCRYRQADAFEELRLLERNGQRYDLVILDPPAFARSKKAVPHAIAGYKEVNLRGLRLLQPGGVLVTCSCSQPITDEDFWKMLQAAARDARRQIRLLEQRGQGPDHPVLAGMPETRYLKCYLVQVF
ncbi:MAG: class I SAM-dependent rRNA methyltransferase [Nitrospira sp.]|jgi:23S rRNA (cytosine1962-C5)-methyltransferase|nr:class I SAM-dependent rRNA methyltransferase [Nitrospira sp.]MBP6198929.1 class I SAM-dependent rRNA methyltransferase [Nitrospira sp.]MBP6205037.1 class I SAM-dependent rRNA methyltransferase [Nitrospira sp.]MBP8202181.1 class I SAM-dependent rRNA methyltransferase [Nitrospira sp.]MBP8827239.1 class I SAM-dependent rRNA methyltransferase [Nitrospira sp.]